MIDVKQIAKPKSNGGSSTKKNSAGVSTLTVQEALHATRADKATHADEAAFADKAGYTSRTAYSDKAGDLIDDSPIYTKFLSRLKDDQAQGL